MGRSFGIEPRISIAAAIIIFDPIFERGYGAVVHVGGRAGDLAQRRRLEVALTRAGVVKALAGEVGAGTQAKFEEDGARQNDQDCKSPEHVSHGNSGNSGGV